MNKVDHFKVKLRLPLVLVYHVGFSIKGDVGGDVGGEVGGEIGGEVGGEVSGEDGGDGGENGDDNGCKDETHTKPICFDYQILFGNSIALYP